MSDERQQIMMDYFSISSDVCYEKTRGRLHALPVWESSAELKDWIQEGYDANHNLYYYGCANLPHQEFSVQWEGTAVVKEEIPDTERPSFQTMYPTKLTTCTDEIKQYINERRRGIDFLEDMQFLMNDIYSIMEYTPGLTNTKTSAGEAFAMKKGVCQDYTHIMITICRHMKVPARYVAGYMVGEGASHAWVSVYHKSEQRWYEFDPTNNKMADNTYIHGAYGMDSSDCIFNKGIYQGFTNETQEIKVIVEEIND